MNELAWDEALSVDVDEIDDASSFDDAQREHHIDDPVRMYLMQMGQIPLLNRGEEVDAAREIERARNLYRHSMLATDFVLQGAVKALEQVRDGELRLDRTIEVSVMNTQEKKNIMRRDNFTCQYCGQ